MPIAKYSINTKFLTTTPSRLILASKHRPDPDRISVDFPIGPGKLSYAGETRRYAELSRPFEKPLLVSANDQLRTVQFSAVVADLESGGTNNIKPIIDKLEQLARESIICTLAYGDDTLPFEVVITKLRKDITRRDGDGTPVRAIVGLTLREAQVLEPRIVEFEPVVFYKPEDDPTITDPEEEEVPFDQLLSAFTSYEYYIDGVELSEFAQGES